MEIFKITEGSFLFFSISYTEILRSEKTENPQGGQ